MIVGRYGGSHIVTLVERHSRLLIAMPLPHGAKSREKFNTFRRPRNCPLTVSEVWSGYDKAMFRVWRDAYVTSGVVISSAALDSASATCCGCLDERSQ